MDHQNSSIKLFQLVKSKTDEQTALDSISVLQGAVKDEARTETANKFNEVRREFTDKFIELTGRVADVKIELTEKINNVKFDLTGKISDLKSDLTDRINSSKVQTIFWIVSMSIVQLLARYFFK